MRRRSGEVQGGYRKRKKLKVGAAEIRQPVLVMCARAFYVSFCPHLQNLSVIDPSRFKKLFTKRSPQLAHFPVMGPLELIEKYSAANSIHCCAPGERSPQ